MRILDQEVKKVGSGMEKSRIQAKHPGTATLFPIHIRIQSFLWLADLDLL